MSEARKRLEAKCPEWACDPTMNMVVTVKAADLCELLAESDRLRSLVDEARGVVGSLSGHLDALSGPNAHRLGCDCGGTDDGKHSCHSLNGARKVARTLLTKLERA